MMSIVTLRPTLLKTYSGFYRKEGKNANICKLRRYLSRCDIIIVKKTMSNSAPCARCLKMLKEYNIRRVYYSYEKELKMEKVSEMENNHLSSKYRRPWSTFT